MNKFIYIAFFILVLGLKTSEAAAPPAKKVNLIEVINNLEFLVIDEAVIFSKVMMFKHLGDKVKKFNEQLEKARAMIEKKFMQERDELENLKNNPEFVKKEAAFRKKVEAYQAKLEALAQNFEAATKSAIEKINLIFDQFYEEISQKYQNKPIFKKAAVAHLPKDKATDITSEFIDAVNKKHSTVSISLPLISSLE